MNEGDVEGRTPLMWASYRGDVTIVEYLLNKGASINHVDDQGWHALKWAIIRNNAHIVALLLSKGAFVDTYEVSNSRKPLISHG